MASYYDRDGNPMTMGQWAERFEDNAYKRVAFDSVGDFEISTVWLGLDHQYGDGEPLIFETMVFGSSPNEENEMRRYTSEDEARAGHAEIVQSLSQSVV